MSDQPSSGQIPIQRVTSAEMCKRFNDGGYWQKVITGELSEYVLEETVSTLLTNEPGPVRSQMVSYRDRNGDEIARVHRFLRPDGSLAASGMPDPKRLVEGGVLYRLEKKKRIATL